MAELFETQAPAQNLGLEGLTKWWQNFSALGAHNYDKYFQEQAQAAQGAKSDALNSYNTAVSGLQGLMGGLTQQAQQQGQSLADQQAAANQLYNQALSGYNQAGYNQAIQSGQVPQATQDYLQQLRDLQVGNVQSDLDKSFAVQQRQLMDNFAGRGILNSSITGNSLAQMEAEKQRRLMQASGDATAQMIQSLIDSPYRQQEAGIQNLGAQTGALQGLSGLYSQLYGNQMQGLAQQGNWGVQIPQAISPLYSMASGMADIPAAMRQAYVEPFQNLWSTLTDVSSAKDIANIQAETSRDIAQMRADEGSDSDWLSGIGSLVGAIGGLF